MKTNATIAIALVLCACGSDVISPSGDTQQPDQSGAGGAGAGGDVGTAGAGGALSGEGGAGGEYCPPRCVIPDTDESGTKECPPGTALALGGPLETAGCCVASCTDDSECAPCEHCCTPEPCEPPCTQATQMYCVRDEIDYGCAM